MVVKEMVFLNNTGSLFKDSADFAFTSKEYFLLKSNFFEVIILYCEFTSSTKNRKHTTNISGRNNITNYGRYIALHKTIHTVHYIKNFSIL